MGRVSLSATVQIEEKHAAKVSRLFDDFLAGLPARIANVSVIESDNGMPKERKGKEKGNEPVQRQPQQR